MHTFHTQGGRQVRAERANASRHVDGDMRYFSRCFSIETTTATDRDDRATPHLRRQPPPPRARAPSPSPSTVMSRPLAPRPPTLPSFPPGARRARIPIGEEYLVKFEVARGVASRPPRRTRHRPLRRALPALGSPPRVARRVDGPPPIFPPAACTTTTTPPDRVRAPLSLAAAIAPRWSSAAVSRSVSHARGSRSVLSPPWSSTLWWWRFRPTARWCTTASEASAGSDGGWPGVVCGSSRMAPGSPNPSARPARYRSAPRPDPGG